MNMRPLYAVTPVNAADDGWVERGSVVSALRGSVPLAYQLKARCSTLHPVDGGSTVIVRHVNAARQLVRSGEWAELVALTSEADSLAADAAAEARRQAIVDRWAAHVVAPTLAASPTDSNHYPSPGTAAAALAAVAERPYWACAWVGWHARPRLAVLAVLRELIAA